MNALLRLTQLSPALVRDILNGRQPKTLSIRWLKTNELPWDWNDQQEFFGGFDALIGLQAIWSAPLTDNHAPQTRMDTGFRAATSSLSDLNSSDCVLDELVSRSGPERSVLDRNRFVLP